MSTGTPRLEWSESDLNRVKAALTAFKEALGEQKTAIDNLPPFGEPPDLNSARGTRDNFIHDAIAIKAKLEGYISYLENVHSQVNGDVQFLLTR